MRRTSAHGFVLTGAACLTAALATPATAKWQANITSGSQYVVEWTQMPDFDQVRDALPNDGKMYCVPTAAFNMMTYIARHGYPDIAPGSYSYWWWMFSSGAYVTSSVHLTVMGLFMGTDPYDGTGGNGASSGLNAWLPGSFIVMSKWAGNGNPPSAKNLGAHMLQGHLVMPVVGWYDTDNYPFIYRDGGHALTLTKVARSGNNISVSWRDPANEQSDIDSQSIFQSHTYATQSQVVLWNGGYPMALDKIVGYGSAYLDNYYAIFPLFGLTQNVDYLKLKIIKPKWLLDYPGELYQLIDSPGGRIDLSILHPEGHLAFVLTDEDKIWKYDQIEPEMRELIQVPNAEDMVFSRFGKLYVLAGRILYCLTLDEDDIPTLERQIILPEDTDTLVADDYNDSLLVLNPDTREIYRYDYELSDLLEVIDVNVSHLRGKGSLAVSPVDGTIFVTSSESTLIYELQKVDDGVYVPNQVSDPNLLLPASLSVTDKNEVIASCDGSVRVFHKLDDKWQENFDHMFAGLEATGRLCVPHSRSNYDPAIHDTPAFRNELPTEFAPGEPDCGGDLDADGDTDQADLGILLASYGVDAGGDLDGDGDTDQADLGALLAAYGCTAL